MHWSVRQTGAEAFGCSVRRCGQLVVVGLEPAVRKLLSTSFLKTAWDRPGAAESEGSVLAALRVFHSYVHRARDALLGCD